MTEFDWLVKALEFEAAARPALQPCDVYKLVFQAVMGADHLLASPRERIVACLQSEWEALECIPLETPEPSLQVLDPHVGIARLHLRPLKCMAASFDSVVEAVLGQQPVRGRIEDAASLWGWIVRAGDLLPEAVRSLDLAGYPLPPGAPHHSTRYGPASYRVLNDTKRFELIRFPDCQRISATAER